MMTKDLATTIMGIIVAVATALMTFNAPPETPLWLQAVGYVAAAASAVWGFFTNKQ